MKLKIIFLNLILSITQSFLCCAAPITDVVATIQAQKAPISLKGKTYKGMVKYQNMFFPEERFVCYYEWDSESDLLNIISKKYNTTAYKCEIEIYSSNFVQASKQKPTTK